MKVFLQKGFWALLFVFTITVGNYCLNTYFFRACNEKMYSGYQTLVLGDSRTLCINESILPQSLNLSDRGQNYCVMYHQLKSLSEFNKYENLILSYSYLSITERSEKSIQENYETIQRLYTYASPLELYRGTTDKKNWLKVVTKNMLSFNLEYFTKYLKIILLKLPPNDRKDIARFQPIEKLKELKFNHHKLSEEERLVKAQGINDYYFDYEPKSEAANLSIQYLDKIVNLCKEKGINLYLVNMPLDPFLRAQISDPIRRNFLNLTQRLSKQDHVHYYNYEDFADNNLALLQDQVHCTPYAASRITEALHPLLKD